MPRYKTRVNNDEVAYKDLINRFQAAKNRLGSLSSDAFS